MRNPFSVEGKVIVVTGAAGKLGSYWTNKLFDLGAYVHGLDILWGDDVTDRESIEKIAKARSYYGDFDGLVNAAGIDAPPGSSAKANCEPSRYSAEQFEAVMRVNAMGAMICTQVFGAKMAEKGAGSIVNIGSLYGMVAPHQEIYQYRRDRGEEFYKPPSYGASKAALHSLTQYFGTYWARRRVRVNTLTLGGVFFDQEPEFENEYSAICPAGRMVDVEETLGPLVFLLSDASKGMTGANLVVDGGFTAW